MSLVTKKAQLWTTQVTSVIMHEIPQKNFKKEILNAGGVMATNPKKKKKYTESFCVIKHLLYRGANILNMYNYTKDD